MRQVFQIPRVTLAWILVSLVAIIVPHVPHMPVWLAAFCAVCVAWRVLIYQGRLSWPGLGLKIGVVALTVAAIVLEFRANVFSTEATVGVLIVGLALKLLEMQRKRDVLLIIYISYFVIVAEFIYSQSIPIAVYMALCLVLVTASLMSLHQNRDGQDPRRTFRLSALMLAQSLPVMLVLFLLFPRLPPLWAMPLRNAPAFTGLSEQMSPGDIGALTRLSDVVFRVQFTGEALPAEEMYWRALTLDLFNGRAWSRREGFNTRDAQRLFNPREIEPWFGEIQYLGRMVEYDVILEPSNQSWVFTLQMPRFAEENLMMREDYQVQSFRPISQRYNYQGRSYLDFSTGPRLSPEVRRRALLLPGLGNEESRAFASRLWEESGADAETYVRAVLSHFREEEFYYVPDPGLLGGDPVDQFLFETRTGFCEHYASAFTFLMRAAGIPARVVTGYLGGEYNRFDDTYTVRQYDAHAWSEVWLEGRGWMRVDPTAAVAPERVQGSDLSFQAPERLSDAGFSLLRFRNNLFLNDLRLRLETIDYAWNRWVLNYDQGTQFRLLGWLFGNVTQQKVLLALLGLTALAVLTAAFFLLRQPARRRPPPASSLYLRYCRILGAMGFERHSGETPLHYYRRLAPLRPDLAGDMDEITGLFMDLAFQKQGAEAQRDKLRRLRDKVRRFRVLAAP